MKNEDSCDIGDVKSDCDRGLPNTGKSPRELLQRFEMRVEQDDEDDDSGNDDDDELRENEVDGVTTGLIGSMREAIVAEQVTDETLVEVAVSLGNESIVIKKPLVALLSTDVLNTGSGLELPTVESFESWRSSIVRKNCLYDRNKTKKKK